MKTFLNTLTASVNLKGVLDIDTVKGCRYGLEKYSDGCYGECYANKSAKCRGFDFSKSVSRNDFRNADSIMMILKKHKLKWFRIGTMGDPCHDWDLTLRICKELHEIRTPVIITKHWVQIPNDKIKELVKYNVIVNTSISPLDDKFEREYRLNEFLKLKILGVKSVLRIVSCKFGETYNGLKLKEIQEDLFRNYPTIDNPLRISKNNNLVLDGDVLVEKRKDLNSFVNVSIYNDKTYIGHCDKCPDQCGVNFFNEAV